MNVATLQIRWGAVLLAAVGAVRVAGDRLTVQRSFPRHGHVGERFRSAPAHFGAWKLPET